MFFVFAANFFRTPPVETNGLKFYHRGALYQFTCLPNGLCSGPRKFTKVLKPPLACLRLQNIIISGYIDDLITLDEKFDNCFDNVKKIVNLFNSLGFVIHPDKSCFVPSQVIEYLGLVTPGDQRC